MKVYDHHRDGALLSFEVENSVIGRRGAWRIVRTIHAFDLGGASVSAMTAIERGDAEGVVFDVLDQLATRVR